MSTPSVEAESVMRVDARRRSSDAHERDRERRTSCPCDLLSSRGAAGWSQVKTIEVHHLGPGRDEILHELLVRVRAAVDFRQRAELRVRAENQISSCCRPAKFARLPISSLKRVVRIRGRLPHRTHIEQVDEEIVGQRLRPLREDAELRLPEVCVSASAYLRLAPSSPERSA